MARFISTSSIFDLIGGLPVHPLAVHLAVVLLPLSALALAVLVFVPKWRKTYLPLTVGALGFSVVAAFVAKESGEALSERVGLPVEHAALGDLLVPASLGLFALGFAFLVSQFRKSPSWLAKLSGGFSVVAVLAVSYLTFMVGHSGAEATWANKISAQTGEEISISTQSEIAAPGTLSAAEVAKHNSPSDCWTVIDGNVYDLTSYIASHPGGPVVLENICGKDGTSAFSGQHSGQQKPADQLASLMVGTLGAAATTTPGATSDGSKPAADSAASDSTVKVAGALTAAEVAKHSTASSCWSVVNGSVYDLTSYVNSHPGGSAVIKSICGKDGTSAFTNQHGTAGRPNNVLAGFLLGKLATDAASAPLPVAPSNAGEAEQEGGEEYGEEGRERDND